VRRVEIMTKVYVTDHCTKGKYHEDKGCYGASHVRRLDLAIKEGREPCEICVTFSSKGKLSPLKALKKLAEQELMNKILAILAKANKTKKAMKAAKEKLKAKKTARFMTYKKLPPHVNITQQDVIDITLINHLKANAPASLQMTDDRIKSLLMKTFHQVQGSGFPLLEMFTG
jgi:hypothetical protein